MSDPDPPTIRSLLNHTNATRENAAVMAQALKYLDTSSHTKIKIKLEVSRQSQKSYDTLGVVGNSVDYCRDGNFSFRSSCHTWLLEKMKWKT
jgi:hypothetical protein